MNGRKVIKKRKGVCEHYARLFVELCRYSGIKSTCIAGYVGHSDYQPEDKRYFAEHAWNSVKIKDKWYLLDATWDSGYMGARKKSFWRGVLSVFVKPDISSRYRFVKKPGYRYFLCDPKTFVLSHLLVDPQWQLLPDPVPVKVFEQGTEAMQHHLLLAAEEPLPNNEKLEKTLDFPKAYQRLKTAENAQAFNPKNHQVMAYAAYNYAASLSRELINKGNTNLTGHIFTHLEKAIKQGRLHQKDNRTIYRGNAARLNAFSRLAVQRNQQERKKNTYRAKSLTKQWVRLQKQNGKLKTKAEAIKKLYPKNPAGTQNSIAAKADTIAMWRDTLATKQDTLRACRRAVLDQWKQINHINKVLPDLIKSVTVFLSRSYSWKAIYPYLQQKDSLILKRRRLYKTLQAKAGQYRQQKSKLTSWLAGAGLMHAQRSDSARYQMTKIYDLRLTALREEEKFLQRLMFFNENTLSILMPENRLLEEQENFAKHKLKKDRQMNQAMYENINHRTVRLIHAAVDTRITMKQFMHRVKRVN